MTLQDRTIYRLVIKRVAAEIEVRYARARIERTEKAMREYRKIVGK